MGSLRCPFVYLLSFDFLRMSSGLTLCTKPYVLQYKVIIIKQVLRECQSSEETAVIRDRSEELKEMMEEVGQLSAERLAALEQALPLAEHFADTHHG